MIARVWRGATRAADADAYADYVAGCNEGRRMLVLLRVEDDRAEFQTIILFDSFDEVRAFAGEDVETAVFFPEDDRYLVEREPTVRHFEVPVSTLR